MTPGHRIERFRFKTARTVRQKAPWARAVHRLGPCLFIAFECSDDALEYFGAVCAIKVNAPCLPNKIGSLNNIGTAVRAAKRRGDLA